LLLLLAGLALLAGILYVSENLRKVDISKGFDRAAWQLPQETIEALGIKAGDQVADIGAGDGYFTFFLAEAVGGSGKVYAVEIDKDLVSRLERQAKSRGYPNVTAVKGQVDDPLLADGQIDLVLVSNTYHHIQNRVEYFRRLRTDLARGGRVAIVDWRPIPLVRLFVPSGHWIIVDSVLAEMDAAGFAMDKSLDFLPFHHFLIFRVKGSIDKMVPSS
jgi:arsenite methyltransferase